MKKIIVSVINDMTTDQRVDRACRTLLDMGFDVLVAGREQRKSLPLTERPYKVKRMSLFFENGPLFYAEFNIRLFFFLLFKKADGLLANDLDTLLANYMASKLKGAELFYDSHEFFTEVPELQNRRFVRSVWLTIEKMILPKLKYTYTVSQCVAEGYKERYGIYMKIVRNIPLLNRPVSEKKAGLRSKGEEDIILYQGVLNPGRGLEYAIEAMQYMEGARLVIVGFGKADIEKKLRSLVNEFRVNDKVTFTGKVKYEEIQNYTKEATIGLLLEEPLGDSFRCCLPNKLFDYIHAEVPILASQLEEIKRIGDQYGVAYYIDRHEAGHIAEKMKELISNASLSRELADNCKKAKTELCWEKEEQKLKEIFSVLNH